MNLEDRLRGAADAIIEATRHESPQDELKKLYVESDQRAQDPLELLAFDHAMKETQLGPAAYALGVHYVVQDKLDEADYWLRVAAQSDVGDAALRLAQLCELRAVLNFNKSEGPDSALEQLSHSQNLEARYWYTRAAAAGYENGKPELLSVAEQPNEPIDCCDHMEVGSSLLRAGRLVDNAQEEALTIVRRARRDAESFVEDAQEEADQAQVMAREARRDAQAFVDEARAEVESLANQREILALQLAQLRSMLEGLATVVARNETGRSGFGRLSGRLRRGRSRAASRRSVMSADVEFCARIIAGVQDALEMPDDEIPSRDLLARAIASVSPTGRQHDIRHESIRLAESTVGSQRRMSAAWGSVAVAGR
ncbi:hypothetical protein ACFO1B_35680 [Dactylosporangium siamense]|uniref:Sel1 repeat family protein n=1 Tax=Dactylosporangium siamense TaxID=685454 RepID=A0A919PJH4_9ACTN|nr:hypothetical protein [Dactylosporangium siamense]GIG45916.1 hypothetical protein Dsi01nite_039570 [Dactylosporangium siamense]